MPKLQVILFLEDSNYHIQNKSYQKLGSLYNLQDNDINEYIEKCPETYMDDLPKYMDYFNSDVNLKIYNKNTPLESLFSYCKKMNLNPDINYSLYIQNN